MSAPAYRERAYTAARANLADGRTPCYRCGAPASSPDHIPPLNRHHHQPGTGCCQLLPSCATCQNRQGARERNRRRRPPATTSRSW